MSRPEQGGGIVAAKSHELHLGLGEDSFALRSLKHSAGAREADVRMWLARFAEAVKMRELQNRPFQDVNGRIHARKTDTQVRAQQTLAAMEHLEMRQRRRERRLEQAFAAIDDDQGGHITLDELRKEMRRADARVSEWQVKARWRELDVDADGKVQDLQAMRRRV